MSHEGVRRVGRSRRAGLCASALLAAGGLVGVTPADAAAPHADTDLVVSSSINHDATRVAAADGTQHVVASGWGAGSGALALDASGNLFVSENSRVLRFPAGGGAGVPVVALRQGGGVAVDSTGNLYVADMDDETLIMHPANGAPDDVLATPRRFSSVAVDSRSGTVYAAVPADGEIVSVQRTGGPLTVVRRVDFLGSVAVAPDGTLYFVAGSTVYRLSQGTAIAVATFHNPGGIALDAAGDLYVAETNDGTVVELPVDGSGQRVVATNISDPAAIALFPLPGVPYDPPGPAPAPVPGTQPATFRLIVHAGRRSITVTASGLVADERFTVSLDRRRVASGVADPAGTARATLRIPRCLRSGRHLVTVIGTRADRRGDRYVAVRHARPAACR